jgi:putative phosphoribosyl transferase
MDDTLLTMGAAADLLRELRVFADRTDAGALLAVRLDTGCYLNPLVLGIPRGGVPVAAEIAHRLDGELDIVVARKLGAPFEPELAIGAVTANGGRYLNDALLREVGATDAYVEAATAQEVAETQHQDARLRGTRPAPRITDRTVIVVDDGLAPGATMRATLRSVRRHRPARVVVAVPVGPTSSCNALRGEADEVIALREARQFLAVGVHYLDFRPVRERQVVKLLQANWRRVPADREEATAQR